MIKVFTLTSLIYADAYFNSRTRLFLAFIQQRTMLGGAPTLRLQVQPMYFTLIPHLSACWMIIII